MTPDQVKRKLTAILSADVKGYSRLIGEDEEGTIRALKAHLEVISRFIAQHQGRVVGTGGDSVLAEFASVVDAWSACAVAIQKNLQDRNETVAEVGACSFGWELISGMWSTKAKLFLGTASISPPVWRAWPKPGASASPGPLTIRWKTSCRWDMNI